MSKQHINEMSPEFIKHITSMQKSKFGDEKYMKTISAYDYLKKLRQINDFEKYADDIVRSINMRSVGALEAIPKSQRVSFLRQLPFETKIAPRQKAKKKDFPDAKKHIEGDYIVKYISSINDEICTVWFYAISVSDAQDQAFRSFWDIKDIIDIFIKPNNEQAKKIDTKKYTSVNKLGDEVAKTLSNGEFQTLPELIADIKDDQTTVNSVSKQLYEGVDIDGNTWKGIKASLRKTADSIGYNINQPHNNDNFDIELITSINENGNDDIDNIRITPELIRKTLSKGIVHIVYMKNDGTERQAFATTNSQIIENNNALYDGSNSQKRNYSPTQIRYYDLTSKAFRSFVIQRLTMVYDETYNA